MTTIEFTLKGAAPGWLLAVALAARFAPSIVFGLAYHRQAADRRHGVWIFSPTRNTRVTPKSTLRTAVGIRHDKIVQTIQDATSGAFNSREFFHGCRHSTLSVVCLAFRVCGFVAPTLLIWLALSRTSPNAVGSCVTTSTQQVPCFTPVRTIGYACSACGWRRMPESMVKFDGPLQTIEPRAVPPVSRSRCGVNHK